MSFDPQRIRELLATQGRTVDWLAEHTGYHPSTVSRFLNGRQPISDEFGVSAARAFQVPANWLHGSQMTEAA